MNIKSLVRSTGIYFIGNVLSKIVVFLLLPIYTSYISPEAMGMYDTGVTIITLFSSMLFLDIGSVILKFTLEKDGDNADYPITNGSIIFLFSCLIYLVMLSVAGIFIQYEYYHWVVLYGLSYALNTAVGYVARALRYNTDYAIAGVLQTILMVVLNIIMLIGLGMDYKTLYISFSISSLVATIYLLIRTSFFKYFEKKYFSKSRFAEMLKFALPLCVNSLAFWLMSSSGRVIVTYVLGSEATGYLSVANKFNQILYLVSTCVHLTWQEVAFSHDNKGENEKGFYSNVFLIYYKVVLFSVALLMLIVRVGLYVFPSFIAQEYTPSINLVPTALIGTGLAIVSQFLGTIFTSIKKTKIIFWSTLMGAITTVVTTFLFIKIGCGPEAANFSFIWGYIAAIVMRIIFLKKYISFKCNAQNITWLLPVLLIATHVFTSGTIVSNIILLIILLGMIPLFFRKEFESIRSKINEHK